MSLLHVPALFLGPIGLPEMLVIGGVIILLFGAKRIPEVARSLGRGVTEFKKGISGEDPEKLPPAGGASPPPPPPRT